MYTLVIILGATLNSVGSYSDLKSCNIQVLELKSQEVKAICVQQQDPDLAMKKALTMMQSFQKMMEEN
jgi:hypothetical protein